MSRPDLTDWNPFDDFLYSEYDSKDDKKFQAEKASYESMSPEEQLKYKIDRYDAMLQDGIELVERDKFAREMKNDFKGNIALLKAIEECMNRNTEPHQRVSLT